MNLFSFNRPIDTILSTISIATLETGKTGKIVDIFGRFMESISRGLAIQALFRVDQEAKHSERLRTKLLRKAAGNGFGIIIRLDLNRRISFIALQPLFEWCESVWCYQFDGVYLKSDIFIRENGDVEKM